MRNILKIIKRDAKSVFTNWVALVVVLALVLIPSLYSLVNIRASWDPYSNTSGVKVAIVNLDKGTNFNDKDINIGNELIEKLKDNDKLGWVFTDKETAHNGLIMEEYYAMIEIPEDFSECVTTIVEKDKKQPTLYYSVNEKKNAIAPKMTDSGVKTIQNELKDNIVKTISGVMFRVADDIGITLKENENEFRNYIDKLYELNEKMPEFKSSLNQAVNGTDNLGDVLGDVKEIIPEMSSTMKDAYNLLNNSKKTMSTVSNKLSAAYPTVNEELLKAEKILSVISEKLETIDESLPETIVQDLTIMSTKGHAAHNNLVVVRTNLETIKIAIDGMIGSLPPTQGAEQLKTSLQQLSDSIGALLTKIEAVDNILTQTLAIVDTQLEHLNKGGKVNAEALKQVKDKLEHAYTTVKTLRSDFNNKLVPSIKKGIDSIDKISSSSISILSKGMSLIPKVVDLLDTFSDLSNKSNKELVKISQEFPKVQNKLQELVNDIQKYDDGETWNDVLSLITNDWEQQSEFLSSSVAIEEDRLFAFPNYGSTCTPFYIILCLWVGGTLLVSLFSTEASPHEGEEEYKPYEKYFGRLIFFVCLGMLQALVASLGALYWLKVYCTNPLLFILFNMFASCVFVTMIYTFVSVFGNVGKVIALVLLVLQLAATGGNFPIEVTPEFFQKLFPMLPFTYAINGVRQIMTGVVMPLLIKDTAYLTIYMVVSIITGLVLKRFINEKSKKLVEKLHHSGLIGH